MQLYVYVQSPITKKIELDLFQEKLMGKSIHGLAVYKKVQKGLKKIFLIIYKNKKI